MEATMQSRDFQNAKLERIRVLPHNLQHIQVKRSSVLYTDLLDFAAGVILARN